MDADRRLAQLERIEKPLCVGVGSVLAALYLWWQYTFNHWIATYTWMIPFAVGYGAMLFVLSLWTTRLERVKQPDAMPEARVVMTKPQAAAAPPPATPRPVAAPAPAPERVDPPAAGEGPRILK